jgi:hypothetical protein
MGSDSMGHIYRRKRKVKRSDGSIESVESPILWIKYYQGGRPIRESTGSTKEIIARRMLRAREGDVEHGIPINPKMGACHLRGRRGGSPERLRGQR